MAEGDADVRENTLKQYSQVWFAASSLASQARELVTGLHEALDSSLNGLPFHPVLQAVLSNGPQGICQVPPASVGERSVDQLEQELVEVCWVSLLQGVSAGHHDPADVLRVGAEVAVRVHDLVPEVGANFGGKVLEALEGVLDV